jgi:hypothetical protein
MMYPTKLDEDYIVRNLTSDKDRIRFGSDGMTYKQMSLFDLGDFHAEETVQDRFKARLGQI